MSGGNDKLERELESFLADDSRVAALYRRLPKDEPDARLDAAILEQARAATHTRRTRPRWLPAMSAAAALVVVAGLAYRVGPQVWSARSGVSEKAEQNVAAPAPVAEPAPDTSASQPATAVPQSAGGLAAPQAASAPAMKRAAPSAAENAPAHVVVERQRHAAADKLRSESRENEQQKLSGKTQPAQTLQSADTRVESKEAFRDNVEAAQSQPAGPKASPEPAHAAALRSAASPPRLDAAPAPPPPAASDAAAANTTNAAKPVSNAFPAAATYAPMSAPASASAPAPAREAAQPAQSAADVEVNLYPEHWIADIRTMLKNGRRDDAIKNLTAFRKRYPDYKLPDDLRDLK